MRNSNFLGLKIDEENLNKISRESKERKFKFDKSIIYPKNNQEAIEIFINSYLFFKNLENNLSKYKDIVIKIEKYISQFDELFEEAKNLLDKKENSCGYTYHRNERKINHFIINNKEFIFNLINTAFPVGRIVEEYDPNTSAGIS
ncbi:MAG: hypothetical protein ACOCV1_00030 [Bacillota bacterium]